MNDGILCHDSLEAGLAAGCPDCANERAALPPVVTRYYTFGMGQAHHINGFTYDPNIVVKITAPDPFAVMEEWFGRGWSMEYDSLEAVDMRFYPRGIKELT